MAVRWGIVSSGRICSDFVTCLNSLPDDEHEIVAIAARHLEKAKEFAHKHNIPKAYGAYDELCDDKDIDIVYIGNLNPDHFRISKLMLESGKHVLCEKPLCMNTKESEELVSIAKHNKRFLMEGLWTRFFPISHQLRKEIENGSIGTPNLIHVMFAVDLTHADRVHKPELGGSVVLDLGVYPIQFVSMVFGGEKPEKITAVGLLNEHGVDEVALITLQYSGNRLANITISSKQTGYNEAIVVGTKGTLRVLPPFHAPTILETPRKTYQINLPNVKGEMCFPNSEGLTYEIQAVGECIRMGLLECPLATPGESAIISHTMSEVRRQLGVN